MNKQGLTTADWIVFILAGMIVFFLIMSIVLPFVTISSMSGGEVHNKVQKCLENPSCNCLDESSMIMSTLDYGDAFSTNLVAREDRLEVYNLRRENCQSP